MNTHADKAAETKSTSIANGSPTRQGNGRASSQFSDQRPEAAALMKMQELAENSPSVSQLRSLQELANNSHQAKQATQFQALADPTAPLPIQHIIANGIAQRAQEAREDDELIQAKTQIAQLEAMIDSSPQMVAQRKLIGNIADSPFAIAQKKKREGLFGTSPVQMAKVAPAAIAEGEWSSVGANGTLNFTALAAGCLAVVAEFADGGGAGVHLAMLMDPAAQWAQFRDAIAAKRISAVHLYSEMVDEVQGWYVKQSGGAPATEMSPRSAWMLNGAAASQNGANDWVWDRPLVINWFAAALGAGAQLTVTNGAVAHPCP
jgi:hypothetical protein